MNYFGAWIDCPFCRREILAEETKNGITMDKVDSAHYVCKRCQIEIVIKETISKNDEVIMEAG